MILREVQLEGWIAVDGPGPATMWQKTQVTPSRLTSRMTLKSWFTNVVGSWHGPQFSIVAPRVTRSEWKYIRPKSWFLDRSDFECDECSH
jgi:hypothetical protein